MSRGEPVAPAAELDPVSESETAPPDTPQPVAAAPEPPPAAYEGVPAEPPATPVPAAELPSEEEDRSQDGNDSAEAPADNPSADSEPAATPEPPAPVAPDTNRGYYWLTLLLNDGSDAGLAMIGLRDGTWECVAHECRSSNVSIVGGAAPGGASFVQLRDRSHAEFEVMGYRQLGEPDMVRFSVFGDNGSHEERLYDRSFQLEDDPVVLGRAVWNNGSGVYVFYPAF